MRLNAAFTSALVSSATLMGYAHAEEAEQKPDVSSVAEKPTFTVCPVNFVPLSSLVSAIPTLANLLSTSPPRFKRLSSSNSPRAGNPDGLAPRLKRMTPSRKRTGPTLATGPLRNRPSSREWMATRVSSSRTLLLTTPFPPSSPRRLTTRARHWWFSMRSSRRVSASHGIAGD